jgi:hypothetical protein
MRYESLIQIDVGNDFPIDDDEGLPLEVLARVIKRATCPEDNWLFDVGKAHSKLASITERVSDRLWLVMKVYQDLSTAILRQVFGNVSDQWLPQYRKRRLGSIFSQWPKTSSVTRRENHCAHDRYSIVDDFEDKSWFCEQRKQKGGHGGPPLSNDNSFDGLRGLGRVAHYQVKRAWRDFAKTAIAIKRNCNADCRILTVEPKTTFLKTVEDLIHM